MKSLIVYYSRTGWTKKVAEKISNNLSSDIEEIDDKTKRTGILGWLRSAREAIKKSLTEIQKVANNPDQYDLVIIGTPIWASHVSTPIRTYMENNKDKFNQVAFFCTCGSGESYETFSEMQEICGKTPVNTLTLKTEEVKNENYFEKVKRFISKIK